MSKEVNLVEMMADWLWERRKTPTLLIHSENAYSVVAQVQGNKFVRFAKHKDEEGIYILLNQRKIYNKNWKPL